jgi:Glyoxalase-like domain
MTLALDHAFITCAAGAPEAAALTKLGFVEGSRNTHPGQGTANRRFFFDNFMLELLWVENVVDAIGEPTGRTRLWERWSGRERGASPFGVAFGPGEDGTTTAPYATWSYRPQYLPPEMAIEIAEGTTLAEPELFYLPFLRRGADQPSQPRNHTPPVRRILGVSVGMPGVANLSRAAQTARDAGMLNYFESNTQLMEIRFAAVFGYIVDLRPTLPLLFRGVA